ncbi:MAG: hypothetical protein HY691_15980 [Chloroflexi bacterium]|nr:hypothetical protein [Chloroflexota bacterium]
MPGEGLLLVMMEPIPQVEDEFNDWYTTEHVPQQLTFSGFLSGRRYRALVGQPRYLTLYELAEVRAVEHPGFLAARPFEPTATPWSRRMEPSLRSRRRGVYQHMRTLPQPEPTDLSAAGALLVVGLDVDPAGDAAFNEWYEVEHLPAMAGVPGVMRARRFKLSANAEMRSADPPTYLAIYDLTDPAVQASAEWARRRDTPWAEQARRHVTRRERWVYERISEAVRPR